MYSLSNLIDEFINLHKNGIKQGDKDWYKLMGTTVGGSEIASIMGLNPYSSFYKIVKSKIDICKGIKQNTETIYCWWGTLFEEIIQTVVEIDLGNEIKGTNICIQKYEGHRTSPDGYIIANFYIKDGLYYLWTTDMPKDLISLSLILLIEFKCPITRKTTGNIPIYYKPQVLSGLSVSPLAHRGLFIDAVFRKCSIEQLGNNPEYDITFHKKTFELNPIAWGTLSLYIHIDNINNEVMKIYEDYFDIDYDINNINIIDLGDISYDIFYKIIYLVNNHQLITSKSTVKFIDGRGSKNIIDTTEKKDHKLFAILPWKLFDLSYVIVDREPNFLENIYSTIKKVHELVQYSIEHDNNNCDNLKIMNICDMIYD